jgi:hypothetical protein
LRESSLAQRKPSEERTVSEALKRIEEKHKTLILEGQPGPICDECSTGAPCDAVKLARALVELIETHGHEYDEYDNTHLKSCDACKAKRTLEEVAGG